MRVIHAISLAALILFYAFLSAALSGPAQVRFLWPTRVVTDQMGTTWIVIVEPHADNRALVLAAYEGDIPVRRTDVQLEGDKAARTHRIEWRGGLPPGELQIVAGVFSNNEQLGRAVVPLTVVQMSP